MFVAFNASMAINAAAIMAAARGFMRGAKDRGLVVG